MFLLEIVAPIHLYVDSGACARQSSTLEVLLNHKDGPLVEVENVN